MFKDDKDKDAIIRKQILNVVTIFSNGWNL